MGRGRYYDGPDEIIGRRKRRRRSGSGLPGLRWFFDLEPVTMSWVGLSAIGAFCILLGIFVPKAAYGAIAVGLLLVVAGNLLFLAAACSAGIGCVLACFFIPFYSLYFLLTNLDETWKSFAMSLTGAVLLIVGFGIKVVREDSGLRRPDDSWTPSSARPSPREEFPATAPFDIDPALKTNGEIAFLSDFKMFAVKNGPWPVSQGRSGAPDGAAVTLNGKVSKHGIGMHPPDSPGAARASFALGKRAKRFKGWVGLGDNRSDALHPVHFAVYGDGERLWDSNGITRKNHPAEFDVDVSRVSVLTLETKVQFHWHAHAIWYEPHVEK